MMHVNTKCRICGSRELEKFLSLGSQPLANRFLREDEFKNAEATYPLEVYFCANCNLAQLLHVVSPDVLFSNYIYFSSGMPKLSDHFRKYAENVMKRFLSPNDFVLEIASNDGILLKFFKDAGYRVLGIDPAKNIAPIAESLGVPTWSEFFSVQVAEKVLKQYGSAQVIMGNNVVAHINDHHDLVRGISLLLDKKGVFVLEAPYLIDMFENLTYDTIYHEHLSYLAVRPLKILFEKFGLEIFDVEIHPVQGQSLRVFVGRRGTHPVGESVRKYLDLERKIKLDTLASYEKLGKRVTDSKKKLLALLNGLKKNGKRIAAYGAPAKGNTLLNYCGIGADILDYAMEDLPSKQGLYTPGMHIPVVSRTYAEVHLPDYYLLLAWNYAMVIFEKEKKFLESGGRFILPTGEFTESHA